MSTQTNKDNLTNDIHIISQDIQTCTVNFEQLQKWRDSDKDDLPICSCLSFYNAIGLMKSIQEYCNSHNSTIVAADNIVCNFYTLQRLKNFIMNTWESYSLDIDKDNHVFWKDDKWGRKKHYPKKVKALVRNSIYADFANFCPGLDDDLDDNILVFRVFSKVKGGDDEHVS